MCGIAGILSKSKSHSEEVQSMCNLISHRGPDQNVVYQHKYFTMGFVRLAIIDLKTGDQPIYNEDKSLSITFNGEIYNFRELRKDLEQKGHRFYTKTDTEVILHLFEEKGVEAFAELNGYFAFSLVDHKHDIVYLVRDQFGIKPLHYYQDSDQMIYASEIKAILDCKNVDARLNANALHSQMNLRYNQLNESMFKNIFRLKPGHYLKIANDLKCEEKQYYQLNYNINNHLDEEAVAELIRSKLKTAVERQMISDVPLGLYLSGGIDSGSLVAMASELSSSKVKTFTLGFNEPTDEFDEARCVAERYGTDHHEIHMEPNPMDLMEKVIWHAEEPKINLIQGYMMSKELSNHVTVALSGLGGDELFAGYDIYKLLNPFSILHRIIPKAFEKTLSSALANLIYHMQGLTSSLKTDEFRRGIEIVLASGNMKKSYLILRNAWDHHKKDIFKIYHPKFVAKIEIQLFDVFEKLFNHKSQHPLELVQWVEFHSKMLNDYLLTEDRMSMANGLEQRVPFLDKDLVEFSFTIPFHLKYKKNTTKYILRKAMQDKLPQKNLDKKKWGFTFNPYLQFQKDLKAKALEILKEDEIRRDEIFNFSYIKKILEHPAHPNLRWHYNFIWLLVGFYIWKDMFKVNVNYDR